MINLLLRAVSWLAQRSLRKKLYSKEYQVKGRLVDKQDLFLRNIMCLIDFAHSLGYKVTAGEMYRTEEQQAIYYSTGKSKVKRSKHQDRLAFDINIFVNDKYISSKEDSRKYYEPLANYWKSLHPSNISGWDWDWDFNHFQMT